MSVPLIFKREDSGPGPLPAESFASVLNSVYSSADNSNYAAAIFALNAGS